MYRKSRTTQMLLLLVCQALKNYLSKCLFTAHYESAVELIVYFTEG